MNIFDFSVKPKYYVLLLCACCCFTISIPCTAWSQGYEDDPLFMEEDEYGSFGMEFEDSEFGVPSDSMDPGLLGEGEYDPFGTPEGDEDMYLDDDQFGVDTEQALKESLLSQGALMGREKREGISNIAYGAGTGLLIGAWTAFITQETTTRNQWRTIGTSTVLGGAIGMLLGTRSIWDPNASRPTTAGSSSVTEWMVLQDQIGFKIAYQWNF